MQSAAVIHGLVFFKLFAHAAPKGKEFSNNARCGAQKKHGLTCFQLQLFKANPVLSADLFSMCLRNFRRWLNTNDLATDCAGLLLLIPKWAASQTNLVDPASSHMLVSRLSHYACLSKGIYMAKLRMDHDSSYSLVVYVMVAAN